jgi:hypothetical protein
LQKTNTMLSANGVKPTTRRKPPLQTNRLFANKHQLSLAYWVCIDNGFVLLFVLGLPLGSCPCKLYSLVLFSFNISIYRNRGFPCCIYFQKKG